MSSSNSVIVTGMGLVTPFGVGCEIAWKNIRLGHSAIRNVPLPLPNSRESIQVFGGPIPEIPDSSAIASRSSPRHSLLDRVVLAAAREAIQDAGDHFPNIPADRIGCVIGTSKPALRSFDAFRQATRRDDSAENSPLQSEPLFSSIWPSAPSSAVAAAVNAQGPCLAPVAACATGLLSVIRGAALIQSGICDAVIAGSVDASLLPMVVGSYRRLGILASDSSQPETACRPFDVNRDGFVIGEGAGVVLLERASRDSTSQKKHYAEFLSGGLLTDPFSLMQPSGVSAPIERIIKQTLHEAELHANDIDYVNLHGSGTRANDAVESSAVCRVFGNGPKCSSVKGGIGHLLGAAGSVELVLSLLAARDGYLPPSINLNDVDPACELNFVGATAEQKQVQHLMKLSLGFGGHLAAAAFRMATQIP